MYIGKAFNLKNMGLTNRERKAMERWEKLPEDIKQKKISNLKQFSPFSRLKQKGYAIVRVGKSNSDFTVRNS